MIRKSILPMCLFFITTMHAYAGNKHHDGDKYVGVSYGLLFGNGIVNTFNSMQIRMGSGDVVVPTIGIITGSVQLVYGIRGFNYEEPAGNYSVGVIKGFAVLNVVVGLSTIALSFLNIATSPGGSNINLQINSGFAPGSEGVLQVGAIYNF